MKTISPEMAAEVIQVRPENTHKGNFGRVLLIGGSIQYGGAIMMAAKACVYSGAGLVTVACDSAVHTSLRNFLPEAMMVDYTDFPLLAELLPQMDVVVIGPGLGLSAFSRKIFAFVLSCQKSHQWYVVDGSALTLLSEMKLTFPYPKKVVYTPHQMEWQRLSGFEISKQTSDASQKKQEELQGLVVLKSHRTKIFSAGEILENPLGCAAQATGGMGDTLAGMIGGFLAEFLQPWSKVQDPVSVVASACYLHSFIAEELAKTSYVVLPTALSEKIPFYMKKFAATH